MAKYEKATEGRSLRELNGLLICMWATRIDQELKEGPCYVSVPTISHEGDGYRIEFEVEDVQPWMVGVCAPGGS